MRLPGYSTDAGIYIHIPFCKSKCTYCGFYSVLDFSLKDRFIEALLKEASLRADKNRVFKTIYIGGGTPSTLSGQDFKQIFETIRKSFSIDENAEITVEVNPESVSRELIKALVEEGVNRISVGVQSANERELRLLGRIHDVKTAERAIKVIQDTGVTNVNVDLIFGIPGQRPKDFENSLKWAVEQGITHISTYSLTVENGTQLHHMVKRGKLRLPDESVIVDLYRIREEILGEYGFRRYEISNFSLPGYECRHNLIYWFHGEYLGLGPSGASFLYGNPTVRFQNKSSLRGYIGALIKGELPPVDSEVLGEKDLLLERIFLYIRTRRGLPLEFAESVFSKREDLRQFFVRNEGYSLNFRGMLIADHLALEIYRTVEEITL